MGVGFRASMTGKVFRCPGQIAGAGTSDDVFDFAGDEGRVRAKATSEHIAARFVGDIGDRGEIDIKPVGVKKLCPSFGEGANFIVGILPKDDSAGCWVAREAGDGSAFLIDRDQWRNRGGAMDRVGKGVKFNGTADVGAEEDHAARSDFVECGGKTRVVGVAYRT